MAGGILFAGYVAGLPVLTSLTDRIDPKRIYLASAALCALAHFGFALLAYGFWSSLIFRALAGMGIAGIYLPGLKSMTDNLEGSAQQRGITYYTSVFALGSGLSILAGGQMTDWLGWRWAFAMAALGAVAAFCIIAWALPARPPTGPVKPIGATFDSKAVLTNRRIMAYVLMLFGTAWEVFAARAWLVVYFTELDQRQPGVIWGISPAVLAACVTLLGVPAAMVLGELAARFNRRRMLIGTAMVSLVLALAIEQSIGPLPWPATFLSMTSGSTSFGRTAMTAAGAINASPEHMRGVSMAVYGAVGWIGGILGPLAVGVALDLAGGEGAPGAWAWGFGVIAFGALAGALCLFILDQES
ncbi:MAG: MFS transporter [Rhodospirillales bacterium]|nr:MFS transporter [Rhodospirillales bacterium]